MNKIETNSVFTISVISIYCYLTLFITDLSAFFSNNTFLSGALFFFHFLVNLLAFSLLIYYIISLFLKSMFSDIYDIYSDSFENIQFFLSAVIYAFLLLHLVAGLVTLDYSVFSYKDVYFIMEPLNHAFYQYIHSQSFSFGVNITLLSFSLILVLAVLFFLTKFENNMFFKQKPKPLVAFYVFFILGFSFFIFLESDLEATIIHKILLIFSLYLFLFFTSVVVFHYSFLLVFATGVYLVTGNSDVIDTLNSNNFLIVSLYLFFSVLFISFIDNIRKKGFCDLDEIKNNCTLKVKNLIIAFLLLLLLSSLAGSLNEGYKIILGMHPY